MIDVRLREVTGASAKVYRGERCIGSVAVSSRPEGVPAQWTAKDRRGNVLATDCPSRCMAIDRVLASISAGEAA